MFMVNGSSHTLFYTKLFKKLSKSQTDNHRIVKLQKKKKKGRSLVQPQSYAKEKKINTS